jgi:Zn-dependent M16 (insulinase) family peptidase
METATCNSRGETFVGTSFLLSPVTDTYTSLLLSVLSQLLLDGPASPFYQSLIDCNLGSEYTPNTGFDCSTRESSFSVGLQGVRSADVDTVRNVILSTFTKVSKYVLALLFDMY